MENKKPSTAKVVFMIIGIIFTICMYPIFLFFPLAGGTASGAINFFADKNIEKMITSSKISSTILDESWKEAENKYLSDSGIKLDKISEIYQRVITEKDIDEILLDTWKGMSEGKHMEYDLSEFEHRMNDEIEVIFKEVPEELFAAWKGSTSSKYFTEGYLSKMVSKINEAFDGLSYEEVKARYEMTGATESFDSYIEKEWESRKNELDIKSYTEASEVLNDVKHTLETNVNDIIGKSEVRTFFDSLKKAQSYSSMLYVIIYGILLFMALILLALFFFAPGGFYAIGVAMVLGGLVCKAVSFLHEALMNFIGNSIHSGVNTAGSIGTAVEDITMNIFEAAMKTLEDEIWKFGRISCIIGIILIGIGIFLQVMAKNKKRNEIVE